MQTSRRLIEDEEIAARRAVLFRTNIFIGEVPDEFQPLRFAAGKRVERLAEPQISEPDFIQNIERIAELFRFADQREKLDRFVNSQLEHVVNRLLVQLHAQDVRLKTAAFAFGAANVKIAQELHLDLFKPGAAAAFAAAAAGVERERARRESLRHRFRLRGEKLAHAIVKAEIKNRGRARRAGEQRLIDHHDIADAMRAGDRLARARLLLARLYFRLDQVSIQNFMN